MLQPVGWAIDFQPTRGVACSHNIGRTGDRGVKHGYLLCELCWGKAMVAYTKPQQRRKKEETERVRGERDEIKFNDLIFEIYIHLVAWLSG